jgi:hypothetical protein
MAIGEGKRGLAGPTRHTPTQRRAKNEQGRPIVKPEGPWSYWWPKVVASIEWPLWMRISVDGEHPFRFNVNTDFG